MRSLLASAAAMVLFAGGSAFAQSTDGGTVLQNTMALYGVSLPSPDAGTTPSSCRAYGEGCGAPMECCSRICTDARCGDGARSCRTPGTPCNAAVECCSAFCEVGICR